MTIYSLYIFDRHVVPLSLSVSNSQTSHCDCVYYQDWHRTSPVRPSSTANYRPNVHRLPTTQTSSTGVRESIFSATSDQSASTSTPTHHALVGSGRVNGVNANGQVDSRGTGAQAKGLPFDEEAKLVYGVVLSLRNMVKKLSGRDEAFTSYRTPHYKLHLYETLTGYRFVLLSDPNADSLRFVLRQLYTGPFVEYVVRNPLIEMDSRTSGIDNDLFRGAVDRQMRGLSMFS